MIENLLQKLRHWDKDLLARRQKGILNEISVKAHKLHLTLTAQEGAEGGAVKLVQTDGDAPDVRVTLRGAEQNAGQEGISRRVLGAVGPQEIDAEAGGLEFIGLHRPQGHARGENNVFCHGISPFAFSIIHDFQENKRGKEFLACYSAQNLVE